MNVFFNGRIAKKALVEIYVMNVCKELNIDRRKKIDMDINFSSKLQNDWLGLCTGDPTFIEIDISRNQTFFEQMLTLAHELVHAKQFLNEEYPSEKEAKSLEYDLFGRCFPWKLTEKS